jgi:putative CocE/NonD family hydrolase
MNALPRPGEVRMQWGVRIPLRDGVHLDATLYLPLEESGPAPTIFVLTPYTGQIHHDQGVHFASCGYPFLTVDTRGRGNSEGVFKPIAHDAQDGYDVVEWLARQSFCDGRVALWGGSYSGYVQWAVAKELPPHLATIVPVAAPFRGVDSPLRNNIFSPYSMQWLAFLSGRTLQDKVFSDQAFWRRTFARWLRAGAPFDELDSFLGNPSAIFQEWLSHPCQEAYWDSYNPTAEQYAELSIPVLTITGMYDANQLGALTYYRQHLQNGSPSTRARHYLVIGPWDHAGTRVPKETFCGLTAGPASLVDMPTLHAQWYDWTMRNGPKPPFLQRNVAYYVMGAEGWRYADSLEDVTACAVTFYLHSTVNPTDVFKSGSLSRAAPGSGGPDRYGYDPRDLTIAELEMTLDPDSKVDQRLTCASLGGQLIYHSDPFESDTDLCGFFRLTVWLAIDQPDTDFHVSVWEIGIDGGAVQLASDSMRARYRESFRQEKLVSADVPLLYSFERFNFVARRVGRGSRLRLVIGPLNTIYWQRNYNSGGIVCRESLRDARPVTVRLFHDDARPSALHVPFGQREA